MTTPALVSNGKHGTRSEQILLFGRNFVKHPRMLGSLIPSSRFLVERVLRQIDWARARTIVEYGPGVGTITGEILRRLRPDGSLVTIEMNRDFVSYLRRTSPDQRLMSKSRAAIRAPRVAFSSALMVGGKSAGLVASAALMLSSPASRYSHS